MRKIVALLFAVMAFFCVNISFQGTAEAARVAVLPIQFSDDVLERASDFTSYYWDIMVDRFKYPDYELMDDEKIATALHDEELKSFDKASMLDVAKKTDADIVVVMRLDRLEEESDYFRSEPVRMFRMNGEYAGFNRLTGKYYYKKFHEKYEVPEELTMRNDWQQMTFAQITKSYVYRTMKAK